MKDKIKTLVKNLILKLRDDEGASYIEMIVSLVVLFLVLAIIISYLSVFTKQSDLKTFTNSVLRTAELTGNIGSEVNDEINRQKAVLGIDPNISFNKTGRVDLGDEIEVEAYLDINIGSSSLGDIPIRLKYKAKGRGEVYWK